MRFAGFCLALVGATGAAAQEPSSLPHVIQVTGIGKISTLPDVALLNFWASGEGKTPDEATSALAARQKAIAEGLNGLLRGNSQITSSNLVVIAVRGADCQGQNNYNPQPRLEVGACAIVGYLATVQGTIRTSLVDKAGTAVGLASQLGARDARLQMFQLSDTQSAYSAAMSVAIADAKRQAAIMAKAAGERLGPVIMIRDQNYRPAEDLTFVALRAAAPPAPAAPPAVRVPVTIDVNPQPIETTAQVYVTFALQS
jgi:uncharacterized protein YggE